MQIIILKDNQSDHFDLIQYPDGQRSLTLKLDLLDIKKSVVICCRIKNFHELEILGCLISALRNNHFIIYRLEFVYLFGIRSDRAFGIGQPNYLRDVLIPIIKAYDILNFTIHWPFFPLGLLGNEYANVDVSTLSLLMDHDKKYFPIAGDLTAAIGMNLTHYFKKTRDVNGDFKITVSEETLLELSHSEKIIIMDDLCDGGGTFIEEAKIIKNINPNAIIKLMVCHGLFTKGIEPLLEYFDEIICTNSYQDICHPKATQTKVI